MNRWKLASNVLLGEGVLLTAMGFGWALGSRVDSQSWSPVLVLCGVGILGLVTGFIVRRALHLQRAARGSVQPRAVDLEETEKALRTYGRQPPLMSGEGWRTEPLWLTMERTQTLEAPFLIEHWKGGALKLKAGSWRGDLAPGQILRVTKDLGSVRLSTDQREGSFGIVHYLLKE